MAKLPENIRTAAMVAGSIAIAQSIAVSIVSCIIIVQFSDCASPNSTISANNYMMHLLKIHYLQDADCPVSSNFVQGLMASGAVFIWMIVLLAVSVLWMIASIALVIVTDDATVSSFPFVAYGWSAVTAVVMVVDIAFGVMFGLDFNELQSVLDSDELFDVLETYTIHLLKIGSFMMMTLVLKGFVLIIVNIAYGVVLVMHGNTTNKLLQTFEHSVHTQGPLNAFENRKRVSDPWHTSTFESPYNRRGPDTENASIPSWRDNANDYSGRAFDRSNSWHHSSNPEDIRAKNNEGPSRVPPAVTSPNIPPWRREPWDNQPPLPAPDYSPVSGRALKSALKYREY